MAPQTSAVEEFAIYIREAGLPIAAAPFRAELTHHDNDAVSYVKQTLEQILKLRSFHQTISVQLSGSFYGRRNRPERSLQIGNRHPDLFALLVAESCRQFGASDCYMGRQFHPDRVRSDPMNFIKQLINPNGQR